MLQTPNQVSAGDLITADLINNILQRLAALESSGPTVGQVKVLDIQPQNPPPHVGDELRVTGLNFGFAAGATRVFLDSVAVNALSAASNDQLLIFNIPNIPGLPAAGRPVTVQVRNLNNSDQGTVTILPAPVVLQGGVDVTSLGTQPTTLSTGSAVTFKYHVLSRANATAIFSIVARVAGQGLPAGFADQLLPNPVQSLTLDPGGEADVTFTTPAIPAAFNNVSFTLQVVATAGGVTNSDGPRPYTVGQAGVQPDPTITLTLPASPVQFTGGGGSLDTSTQPSTIRMPAPGAGGAAQGVAIINVFASLKSPLPGAPQDQSYTLSASLTSGSGWSATVNTQLVPNPFTIAAADFAAQPAGVTKQLKVVVSPLAGATAAAALQIELQRTGSPQSQTLPLSLATS